MTSINFNAPLPSEADNLVRIDELVAAGLSRERATRVMDKLNTIIDGAWQDFLKTLCQPDANNMSREHALIQTCFIAYLSTWLESRLISASIVQLAVLRMLAEEDADKKETN